MSRVGLLDSLISQDDDDDEDEDDAFGAVLCL
jgi:hypothetical protein